MDNLKKDLQLMLEDAKTRQNQYKMIFEAGGNEYTTKECAFASFSFWQGKAQAYEYMLKRLNIINGEKRGGKQ